MGCQWYVFSGHGNSTFSYVLSQFDRNVPRDKGYQMDIVDVRYKKGLTCVNEFATSLSHLHEASLRVQESTLRPCSNT